MVIHVHPVPTVRVTLNIRPHGQLGQNVTQLRGLTINYTHVPPHTYTFPTCTLLTHQKRGDTYMCPKPFHKPSPNFSTTLRSTTPDLDPITHITSLFTTTTIIMVRTRQATHKSTGSISSKHSRRHHSVAIAPVAVPVPHRC